MPEKDVQFDEDIKVDYVEDVPDLTFDTGSSDSVADDPHLNDDPFVFDDQVRVIRPLGQQDTAAQSYGQSFFQGDVQTLTATTAISPIAKQVPVAGSGGAVSLSVIPSITIGVEGQELIIVGTSDANTVRILDGYGTRLVGPITLGNNDTLSLYCNGTVWIETARTNWQNTSTSSSTSSVSTSSSSSSSTTTP